MTLSEQLSTVDPAIRGFLKIPTTTVTVMLTLAGGSLRAWTP